MRAILNTFALAAVAIGTMALIPQRASAERVCRQECSGCTEKCLETPDWERERITIEGRGDRHEEIREERRQKEREPGVELKVPGVGVEIGH